MSTGMNESSSHDTDLYGYDEPMVGPLDAPERPSGFHPVNVGHLVMGVAFAGMVLVWALVQGDVVADRGAAVADADPVDRGRRRRSRGDGVGIAPSGEGLA